MSVLPAESRWVQPRPWYLAQLTVLGAGLMVAAMHGTGSLTAKPAPVAATTYRPPLIAPAPAPAARVHTFSVAKTAPKATRRVPAPVRATQSVKPRPATTVTTPAPKPAPTFQQALDAAVARIPTYRPGSARWVVSRAYDFWGTADWYHDVLYVSPDVPMSKLYDVAVHEWSHELSVLDYAGDVAAATTAMNTWFGGSGLTGPERAADCMAVLQGARWTHYTTCTNAVWRAGAAKLIAGQRL
jgi:hypothetical protein